MLKCFNGVGMTKEEALEFKNRWQLVNDFIAEEIRTTPPEVRFRQLRTMVATAHRLREPDSPDGSTEAQERWQLIKERLHA
jgi:hypothetical protein